MRWAIVGISACAFFLLASQQEAASSQPRSHGPSINDVLEAPSGASVLAEAPQWLPDGTSLIVLRHSSEGTEAEREGLTFVEAVDVATGQTQRLAQCARPTLSPDGRVFACFSSGGDGAHASLRVYSTAYGDLVGQTPIESGRQADGSNIRAYAPLWSHDGKYLAIVSVRVGVTKATALDGSVAVYGGPTKGSATEGPATAYISVYDTTRQMLRQLPIPNASHLSRINDLSWASDDSAISAVFTFDEVMPRPTTFFGSVSTAANQPPNLEVKLRVPVGSSVTASSDPSTQLLEYNETEARWPRVTSLRLEEQGVVKVIEDGHPTFTPVWSSQNQGFWLSEEDVPLERHLFRLGSGGQLTQITFGAVADELPAVSPRGDKIAWIRKGYRGEQRLMMANTDGSGPRVVTNLYSPKFGVGLPPVQRLTWRDADGVEVGGLLYRPLDGSGGEPHPLLVDIHGGPLGDGLTWQGGVLMTPFDRDYWTSLGFYVFAPDYRSSGESGGGQILLGKEKARWLEMDADDVLTGIASVLSRENIDARSIFIIGHSYGSTVVNTVLETGTRPFAASVSYEGTGTGLFNWSDLAGETNQYTEWMYGGNPASASQRYESENNLHGAKNIQSPVLFVYGDHGTGSEEAEKIFEIVEANDVDAEFLVYRNEGHVLSAQLNRADLFSRVRSWIGRHCNSSYCRVDDLESDQLPTR